MYPLPVPLTQTLRYCKMKHYLLFQTPPIIAPLRQPRVGSWNLLCRIGSVGAEWGRMKDPLHTSKGEQMKRTRPCHLMTLRRARNPRKKRPDTPEEGASRDRKTRSQRRRSCCATLHSAQHVLRYTGRLEEVTTHSGPHQDMPNIMYRHAPPSTYLNMGMYTP